MAIKCALRYIISVLEKCRHKHIFPMSLGCHYKHVYCSHTFKLKKLDIVLSAFIILDDFALDYVHYVVFPVEWFAAEDYIYSTDDFKSRLKGVIGG